MRKAALQRVGFVRPQPEVVREDALPDQADDAAERDAEADGDGAGSAEAAAS